MLTYANHPSMLGGGPMVVVIVGIDGSGKATLSSRVAEAFRAAGLTVGQVREGGRRANSPSPSARVSASVCSMAP